MDHLDFRMVGDGAVRVGFGDEVSPTIHMKIHRFCVMLKKARLPSVIEWVPSYTAVTLFYERRFWSYHDVVLQIKEFASQAQNLDEPVKRRTVRIPVCYGGDFGPDLEEVTKIHGLSESEVIRLHTSNKYLVYMIGFAPGFPYLGGLDPQLATPRKKEPRLSVPAGSVGIAGEQTGVYPISTPGGWQIIGRTPIVLYDPNREPPTLLSAGDELIFYAISPDEFHKV